MSEYGYGRVGAQVRSNNDVPLWVTNSFITGLEQAGYRVERVETAETAQTPVAIDVTVSRVFVDYTPGLLGMSGTGDIATQVEVYKQGRRVLRRVYVGKHEGFNLLAAPAASEYQGLLDGAMKDLLQKAVPDLTNAVSRAFEDPVQK